MRWKRAATTWRRQIELIKPRLIVTLGRLSLGWFFPGAPIGKAHGTAAACWATSTSIHLYHPAAALHAGNLAQSNPGRFREIPAALAKAREAQVEAAAEAVAVGAGAGSERSAASDPPPEQMRLL